MRKSTLTTLMAVLVAVIFTVGCGKVVPTPNTPPPGNNQPTNAAKLEVKEGEPNTVKVKGADQKLTAKKIEPDKATFEFEGKPAFIVKVGESQKVDIDGDGTPDVEVQLHKTKKPENGNPAMARVMVTELAASSGNPPGPPGNGPAPEPVQGHPDLLTVKDWQEFIEVVYFVDRFTALVINKEFVTDARKGAAMTLGDPALVAKFSTLFDSFDETMKEAGTNVPAKANARMLAYFKANGCEQVNGSWPEQEETATDGCVGLYKKAAKVFDALVADAPATDDFTINAKKLRESADGYAEGHFAVILTHGALAMLTMSLPESKRPWALSNSNLKGKDACYYVKKDDKWLCGPIEKVEGDGITINGQKITFDQMDAGDAMFCKGKECNKMGMGKGSQSYAEKHRFSIGGRGVWRIGSAEGYEGLQSNPGFMVVPRFNILDNFSAHLGVGVGGLTGKPTIGVNEQDSRTVFMGMAGLSVTLGDRYSWPLLIVLETNMTFQQLPGVEAAVGIELFPDHAFDLRILGTVGYYTTGMTLFTHPDFDLPTYVLPAGGLALEVGWTP